MFLLQFPIYRMRILIFRHLLKIFYSLFDKCKANQVYSCQSFLSYSLALLEDITALLETPKLPHKFQSPSTNHYYYFINSSVIACCAYNYKVNICKSHFRSSSSTYYLHAQHIHVLTFFFIAFKISILKFSLGLYIWCDLNIKT